MKGAQAFKAPIALRNELDIVLQELGDRQPLFDFFFGLQK